VSVFRPAAKVRGPDGREWEIYAYRFQWTKPKRRRDLPQALLAAYRATRSSNWTIDAVTRLPHQSVYTWTTTAEHKGQVLAQVEGSLARGDLPIHLRNAVYRGEDRRSAR
jgi:hypothetical protein